MSYFAHVPSLHLNSNQLQVTSIVLDSHFRYLTEEEDYRYSKLFLLRAPANLSALPDVHTDKVRNVCVVPTARTVKPALLRSLH